jgi:acyl-CoA thioester hydrolase
MSESSAENKSGPVYARPKGIQLSGGVMSDTPVVYKSTHRINFADLDPHNHMHAAAYSAYYIDHRMNGLREHVGWDIKTLAKLPFMPWVRRMEIDFVRPAVGDQEITITSFVREFRGPDAHIECSMIDAVGGTVSRCLMIVAYVDKSTNRAANWPADTIALLFNKAAA